MSLVAQQRQCQCNFVCDITRFHGKQLLQTKQSACKNGVTESALSKTPNLSLDNVDNQVKAFWRIVRLMFPISRLLSFPMKEAPCWPSLAQMLNIEHHLKLPPQVHQGKTKLTKYPTWTCNHTSSGTDHVQPLDGIFPSYKSCHATRLFRPMLPPWGMIKRTIPEDLRSTLVRTSAQIASPYAREWLTCTDVEHFRALPVFAPMQAPPVYCPMFWRNVVLCLSSPIFRRPRSLLHASSAHDLSL